MAIADVFYKISTLPGRVANNVGRYYTARDYMIKNDGSLEDHAARLSKGSGMYSGSTFIGSATFLGLVITFNSPAIGTVAAVAAVAMLPALVMWGTALSRIGKRRADIASGVPVAEVASLEQYKSTLPISPDHELPPFLSVMSQMFGGLGSVVTCVALTSVNPFFALSFPVMGALAYSTAVHGERGRLKAMGFNRMASHQVKSVVEPVSAPEEIKRKKKAVLSSIKHPVASA